MSVDTEVKLDNSIGIVEIEDAIKRHYKLNGVEECSKDSFYINFEINGHGRSLHIYIGYNRSTETVISKWLSLGLNDEAIEVMKTILSYFGGWFDENDCDDKDFYWVEKTRDLGEPQKYSYRNKVCSALNDKFTYDEINKIIGNKDLLLDILEEEPC